MIIVIVVLLSTVRLCQTATCEVQPWYQDMLNKKAFHGDLSTSQLNIKDTVRTLIKNSHSANIVAKMDCEILGTYEKMLLPLEEQREDDREDNSDEDGTDLEDETDIDEIDEENEAIPKHENDSLETAPEKSISRQRSEKERNCYNHKVNVTTWDYCMKVSLNHKCYAICNFVLARKKTFGAKKEDEIKIVEHTVIMSDERTVIVENTTVKNANQTNYEVNTPASQHILKDNSLLSSSSSSLHTPKDNAVDSSASIHKPKETDHVIKLYYTNIENVNTTEQANQTTVNQKEGSINLSDIELFRTLVDQKTGEYLYKIQAIEIQMVKLENVLLMEKLHKQNNTSNFGKLENQVLKVENELLKMKQSYNELKEENNYIRAAHKSLVIEMGEFARKNVTQYPAISDKSKNEEKINKQDTKINELNYLVTNQSSSLVLLKNQSEFMEQQNRILHQIVINQTMLVADMMKKLQHMTELNFHQKVEQHDIKERINLLVKKAQAKPRQRQTKKTAAVSKENNSDILYYIKTLDSLIEVKSRQKQRDVIATTNYSCRYSTYLKILFEGKCFIDDTNRIARGIIGRFPLIQKVEDIHMNTILSIRDNLVPVISKGDNIQDETMHNIEEDQLQNLYKPQVHSVKINPLDVTIETPKYNDETMNDKIKDHVSNGYKNIIDIKQHTMEKDEDEEKVPLSKLKETINVTEKNIDDSGNKSFIIQNGDTNDKEFVKEKQESIKTEHSVNVLENTNKASIAEVNKSVNDTNKTKATNKKEQKDSMKFIIPPIRYEDKTQKEPKDCYDLYKDGKNTNGQQRIRLHTTSKRVQVDCDMKQGGWTIIQRRQDGKVDFFRDWKTYKKGFGDAFGEHWFGNDKLHILTNQDYYSLRVELHAWNKTKRWAEYDYFMIEPESEGYRLHVTGYSGDAGDGLGKHDKEKFSTKDVDNDRVEKEFGGSCAKRFQGAWWYYKCYASNLNGIYYKDSKIPPKQFDGITWKAWMGPNYSFKKVVMMVRPKLNK